MTNHDSQASLADQFTAAIAGQPAASIVQFYIEGTDSLGATAAFPAGGPNSRALYVVQDNQAMLRDFLT